MKVLEAKYPGVVTTVVSGQSYEERDVMGIKISYGADHPAIFIESGMHAREWISPATATYIANELLTSEDPEVRRIAESYDWYIFPITNPDGYEYTWQVNRLWRKTRKPCGLCYGADPNRNWDFHWREAGTSSYPCSEVYAGKKAFSESETKSLADFISTISGLKLYVSIHSYSQLLLYPFGVKSVTLSNTEDYDTISNATVEAIAQRYGTKYIYGNIVDTIYPAAGASICWVNGVLNVPLTFAFELRPDSESEYGFLLPPDQIIPTGEETLDGFVAMIQTSESLGYMTFYQNLSTIHDALHMLVNKHPDAFTMIGAGKSYEGREILGVKVTRGKDRPIIFIEGGIHAREWIAPATVMHILGSLAYLDTPEIRHMLLNYEWHVFPVVNPDGYVYSHDVDRMWRKTRQPYKNCFGADPNRNWDINWKGDAVMDDPCSDVFPGPHAESEPEIKALANYLKYIRKMLNLYVSFHSYSQLLMFPYAYKKEHHKDYKQFSDIANAAKEAIIKKSGIYYKIGSISEVIYQVSGSSLDWVSDVLGVPLAFVYELRPFEASFELPEDQIVPVGEEIMESLKAMIHRAEELGYMKKILN
ncbi:zinc carboxypeptidase A 1-like [Phlebotomus argentipes]|uniref:zinc carboxypeptidase A 1-like n=1 Tax=Phlebotomus argentipes TaxID=94469 RepID=UPI0028937B75|nr:zinc carboxypeptidase A 1-like [Phlebotomus argentipes]